mgnify:CR=1 FL=1
MDKYLNRAKELETQLKTDRQHIHQNAEAGMCLPNTTTYVKNRLLEIGLEPEEICTSGVSVLIKGDKPGKTILLRADMDALPMGEDNALPFKSTTNAAHTCGHDLHTAMLLGAEQILKESQHELCGNVKLMFQPGEELFQGSKTMIDAGILENPAVDAAMSMHVIMDTAVPTVYTNPELAKELASYVADFAPGFIADTDYKVTASDDVAFITGKSAGCSLYDWL